MSPAMSDIADCQLLRNKSELYASSPPDNLK